jgi:bifunctional NMN adenylyltransferase/nudix hydrolase
MEKEKYKNYDCGCIVGRFQTPELHSSHKKLFDHVTSRHEKVICILGLSPLKSTKRNPLDFQQRKQMILESYPNVICVYIKDTKEDDVWSKNLDEIIADQLMPSQKPLLYGSRDSFIKYYSGRFDTEELESDSFISATEVRKAVTRTVHSSKDFRMGMVCGASNRYPINYVTVDVAIMDKDQSKILLVRKPDEKEYRFVGGFTDPRSACIEDDAKREVLEETKCVIDEPKYVCSMRVSDWRYAAEEDKICTTLFIGNYVSGSPEACDDVAEIRWFSVTDFIYETGYEPFGEKYKLFDIVVEHRELMKKLLDFVYIPTELDPIYK